MTLPHPGWVPLVQSDETADRLERLDPVCLMEVDPATARHTVDYLGRTLAFCAPSCKQQFLADLILWTRS
jgi:YHS domain-containing protein